MKTICVILLFFSVSLMSQETISLDSVSTTNSPNAFAFQEINFLETDEYTGKANITIPIWEIELGGLVIPISISYNSGGVKVGSVASDIGLNWALNAGGVITKSIRGQNDFKLNTTLFDGNIKVNNRGFLLEGKYLGGGVTDGQPDLFFVTAPGLKTVFTHQSDITPFEIEKKGNVITTSTINDDSSWWDHRNKNDIDSINIISTKGIKYDFFTKDSIWNDSYRTDFGSGRNSITRYYNTYHIDKITNLTNLDEVTFEYEEYSINDYEARTKKEYVFRNNQYVGNFDYTTKIDAWFNRIKKINFRLGSIDFIYSSQNRTDLPGTNGKLLEAIEIKNYLGQLIKKVNFIYSYFESEDGCTNPECYRLKLTELYFSYSGNKRDPSYIFNYDSVKLPNRYSYKTDFFGYFNGANASSGLPYPIPKIYYYPFQGKNSLLPFEAGNEFHSPPSNYTLASNLSFAQAASLKNIIYPTGGKLELEHELNSFLFLNEQIIGGGLRIKRQILKDEYDQVAKEIGYSYLTTNNQTSGSILQAPRFSNVELIATSNSEYEAYSDIDYLNAGNRLEFKVYNDPKQESYTQGGSVAYSRVVVSQSGNGSKELLFSNPQSDLDVYPSSFTYYYNDFPTPFSETSVNRWLNFSIENGLFPNIKINKDIMRGKMQFENIYNESDSKVHSKEYTYIYKTFENIDLKDRLIFPKYRINNPAQYSYVKTSSQLFSERLLISSIKEINYFDDTLSFTNSYLFDINYPFVKEESISSSYEETKIKRYYPFDSEVSSQPFMSALISLNRISEIVKQESFENIKLIDTRFFNYKDFGTNLILPESISSFKGLTNPILRSKILERDTYGNILEYSQIGGINQIIIWGYYNSYPTAKIENATSAEIASFVVNIQNLSNADNDRTQDSTGNEGALRDALNNLRTQLPNALITTYTYDPLIGVTSVTGPSGYTTYYEYDDLNRLKAVRDANGKLLSENEYHYQNQQ